MSAASGTQLSQTKETAREKRDEAAEEEEEAAAKEYPAVDAGA